MCDPYIQTARESPDLNMDFRSFDNWFKQLYARIVVHGVISSRQNVFHNFVIIADFF